MRGGKRRRRGRRSGEEEMALAVPPRRKIEFPLISRRLFYVSKIAVGVWERVKYV